MTEQSENIFWSEDVAIEVEALQATYGEDLVLDEPMQQISMTILPQQDSKQHYVQCQVLLTLPPAYPSEQPPTIHLQGVKGFTNRQHQLQEQLAADAVELTGELLMGHLFEAAKAWLTEQDWPEGPCIFCLEDLAAAAGSNTPTVRLPCFHAYHESCFADWWCWQQQAYCQQQKALEEKTGATAAATLVQEKLPPKDGLHFKLSCPSCRSPFRLRDLPQPMQQQLRVQRSQQQAQQAQAQTNQQQQQPAAAKLTAVQLQPFLELQQRHAQLFAKQQQRQGIIDTDVGYSISNWDGPSSSTASGRTDITVPPSHGSAAPSSAVGGITARRGVRPNRTWLPGRGSSSSDDIGGTNSSRGRARGRGRGHHQRPSDGSGGISDSMQERQQQAHSQQPPQRTQHGPHARPQQVWQKEEQEWAQKPGRYQLPRGSGQRHQRQQQQQAGPVQQHGVSVQAAAPKQQQQQQQPSPCQLQQQPLPHQQQQAAQPQHSVLQQPEQPSSAGRPAAHAAHGGRSRGRSGGAGRARGQSRQG